MRMYKENRRVAARKSYVVTFSSFVNDAIVRGAKPYRNFP